VNILGAAGSWQAIEDFVAHLGDRIRTMWVRFYVAILFGMSCDRRAVDRLLELYAIGTDPEEDLDQTLRELSFLLEPADLEIFEARHDQPEQAGLVGLVQPLRRFVEKPTLEAAQEYLEHALAGPTAAAIMTTPVRTISSTP